MDAVTRVKLQAAVACVVLLVAGFVLGLVVAQAVALRRLKHLSDGPPGEAETRTLLWVADSELHVDAEQRTAAIKIVERYRPRFVEVRRKSFHELDSLRLARYAEIRTLLHPDQLPEFDSLVNTYESQLAKNVGLLPDGGFTPLESEAPASDASEHK
jgi:hypothetical protein